MRSRVDFVRSSTSAALRWAVGMGGRTGWMGGGLVRYLGGVGGGWGDGG